MDSDFWKRLEYAYCRLNSDSSQICVTPPVPLNCIYWREQFAFNCLETLLPASRHQTMTLPLKSHLSVSRKDTTKVLAIQFKFNLFLLHSPTASPACKPPHEQAATASTCAEQSHAGLGHQQDPSSRHQPWALCFSPSVASRQAGHNLRVLAQSLPSPGVGVRDVQQKPLAQAGSPSPSCTWVRSPRDQHCFLGVFLRSQLTQELSLPVSLNASVISKLQEIMDGHFVPYKYLITQLESREIPLKCLDSPSVHLWKIIYQLGTVDTVTTLVYLTFSPPAAVVPSILHFCPKFPLSYTIKPKHHQRHEQPSGSHRIRPSPAPCKTSLQLLPPPPSFRSGATRKKQRPTHHGTLDWTTTPAFSSLIFDET